MRRLGTSAGIGLALSMFCAATAVAPSAPDRTTLPMHEPQYPHSTVVDVRNAPPPPPRFEVKAPAGAPNVR
jgi:arylsulfatase